MGLFDYTNDYDPPLTKKVITFEVNATPQRVQWITKIVKNNHYTRNIFFSTEAKRDLHLKEGQTLWFRMPDSDSTATLHITQPPPEICVYYATATVKQRNKQMPTLYATLPRAVTRYYPTAIRLAIRKTDDPTVFDMHFYAPENPTQP
jgi:hypothetical protein